MSNQQAGQSRKLKPVGYIAEHNKTMYNHRNQHRRKEKSFDKLFSPKAVAVQSIAAGSPRIRARKVAANAIMILYFAALPKVFTFRICAYHLRVKPSPGNFRYVVSLKEAAIMTRRGPIRKYIPAQ